MKDKEKQFIKGWKEYQAEKKQAIEEMAKEIFNTCAWRFDKPDDYKEIFNDIAKDLTKLNYRKLPEDSVVLSREEYNELKYAKIERNRLDKSVKYYQGLIEDGKLVASVEIKETAEKIIKWFKENSVCIPSVEHINEFAKQFGVEIKE